jgi:hypothetical protein
VLVDSSVSLHHPLPALNDVSHCLHPEPHPRRVPGPLIAVCALSSPRPDARFSSRWSQGLISVCWSACASQGAVRTFPT